MSSMVRKIMRSMRRNNAGMGSAGSLPTLGSVRAGMHCSAEHAYRRFRMAEAAERDPEDPAEEIAEANPTFIFPSSDVSIYTRDRTLKTLDCVKENRVIKIEPYKLNYASQSIAECISTMFAAINAVQIGS